METAQAQPRQARIEISASGDNEVDTRVSNAGLVVARIGKRGCAALRHPFNLIGHEILAKHNHWDRLRLRYAIPAALDGFRLLLLIGNHKPSWRLRLLGAAIFGFMGAYPGVEG